MRCGTTRFSKNRNRLIAHDVVIELFNATVDLAQRQGLLSAYRSRRGPATRVCGARKGSDGREPEDWRGDLRSNDTHELKRDPQSRLYRKSNAAPALPSVLGHEAQVPALVRVRPGSGKGRVTSVSRRK